MLSVSSFILLVCLIVWPVQGQLPQDQVESCRKQTTYNLKDQPSVKLTLYFDVDKSVSDLPDASFVALLCNIRKIISKVTLEFYPGVSTKINKKGEVECYHADDKNTDCTDAFALACASKIVSDFPTLVCGTSDGKSVSDCLKEQNPDKITEFEQCTQLKHPTIRPEQVLLENVNKGKAAYPSFNWFPILTFNDVIDGCARFILMDDQKPVQVICAMLAKDIDEACKKKN